MPEERQPGLFAARNPRFYYAGLIVSQVGTNMQLVALGWFTYQLSHNALVLGAVTAAPIFTMLMFSQAGGVVADRFPPRRVLLCTHSLLALLALGLGLLAESGSLTVWHLVAGALCVGGVNAIGLPAEQVFASEIAGDTLLRRAVTLNNVVLTLSLVVGSAAASPLVGVIGLSGVILLNAGSYLTMITALLLVRPAELHARARTRSPGTRTRVGPAWAYVGHHLGLTLLLAVIGTVGLFGTSLPSLLLLLTSDELGEGGSAYGVLLAVISVGSMLGAWLTWRTKVVLGTVLTSSLLLGVLELVTAAMPSVPALALVLLPLGAVSLVLRAGLLSLVQLQTRPDFRGRVMAIFQLVYRAGWFLGTLLAGWLSQSLGPRYAIAAGGAMVSLTVLAIIIILRASRALSLSLTRTPPAQPDTTTPPPPTVPLHPTDPLSPSPLAPARFPRLHVSLAPPPVGRHRRRPRHGAVEW